jgi:hypothetical protein
MRALFVVLMAVVLGACGSMSGSKEPKGGGEVFKLEGENPLNAELNDCRIVGGRKFTAEVTFTNPGTKILSFKRENVALVYNGTRLIARDIKKHEMDVDIPPGTSKTKYWGFHTDDPQAGAYDVVVSGIMVHEGAEKRPLGRDLTIRIKID